MALPTDNYGQPIPIPGKGLLGTGVGAEEGLLGTGLLGETLLGGVSLHLSVNAKALSAKLCDPLLDRQRYRLPIKAYPTA
ncbi:hypothetical protein PENSUB_551 [Penicillium subrubescens]|uniref:Uncharacterized protein n=1 Tax=Penicillium subrubescens TaxID=1316194 RepID=A0A1Q5UMQ6_9EURO|nr:hypothetical protein PENSUB_551 [Penicillium subrubescens]